MEKYRQVFVLSDRDDKIAFCSGNSKYAVWKDADLSERKNTISISKMISYYLYNPFQPFEFALRKSACIQKLVKAEISERLDLNRVDRVDLDAEFEKKCKEKHGLGERALPGDIEELKEMALVLFRAFREFFESGPVEIVRPLRTNFIKSDYSIWADIILKDDENTKCLCGTISTIYWIDEKEKRVGIVSWNTSENIESPVRIENGQSPFFGFQRTLLQKSGCESHLRAAILEKKYGLTVDANIIHLAKGNQIYPVNDWKECECRSVYKFCD